MLEITRHLALTARDRAAALLCPNAESVACLTAILCAHDRAPEVARSSADVLDQLAPGDRVWVLPDAGVYCFDGKAPDGFWLQPVQVAAKRSAARFWVSSKEAWRLQPTVRLSPMGPPHKAGWAPARPTSWDVLTGAPTYGNPALGALAVVLIGDRSALEDELQVCGFAAGPQGSPLLASHGLLRGAVEDDGTLAVNSRTGAAGEPLIAVARTHQAAARVSERNPDRPLVFISGRVTDALADRSTVDLIAARHRFLLIAPPRRRDDLLPLREAGWDVVEPRRLGAASTGVRVLDEISQASEWEDQRPGILDQRSPELSAAFQALDRLGKALEPSALAEEDIAGGVQALRGAFFSASDWLSAPDDGDLADLHEAFAEMDRRFLRLHSFAGQEAVQAADLCRSALDRFALLARRASMTPKGECVGRLAEAASRAPEYRQAIVVGHASAATRTVQFLDALDLKMTCLTPAGLSGEGGFSRLNILSMMRRETFFRLMDPRPAPALMFLGYTHEVDIYRARLDARERARRRLAPSDDACRRFPLLLAHRAPPEPIEPAGEDAEPATLVTSRPVKRPSVAPGEQTRDARVCRFAGQSWMAVTAEHALTTVRTTTRGFELSNRSGDELETGEVLLVRDGANPDVVREMAESLVGEAKYARLREQACHWSRELGAANLGPDSLQKRLAENGVRRGAAAIRHWLGETPPIGPSEEEITVPGIAASLGQDPGTPKWVECISAIRALRALHTRAGFSLTDALTRACGGTLVEHSDHETPILLPWGTVWLLEVESIEPLSRWPYTLVNRLRWDSDSWRNRLLTRQILASLTGDVA